MPDVDLAAYRQHSDWHQIPEAIRETRIERTVGLEVFPGCILPAFADGMVQWYAVAETPQVWRALQPLLMAYVGQTVTAFSGEPTELDDKLPVEAYLKSLSPYAVARLCAPNKAAFADRALARLVEALESKPSNLEAPPASTAQMIAHFDMCLVEGDRDGAERWLERLERELRLDAINLSFSRTRLRAAFRDWSSILSDRAFKEMCRVSKPPMVARHLLEAVWYGALEPLSTDETALIETYQEKWKQPVEEVFGSTSELGGDVVDRFLPLLPDDLHPQDEKSKDDLDYTTPSAIEEPGRVHAEKSLGQSEVSSSEEPVPSGVATEGGRQSVAQPANWGDWLIAVNSLGFQNPRTTAEEVALRDPAAAYEDPNRIQTLASAIEDMENDLGVARRMCALPILIQWLRTDPGYPRKEMKPIYEACLTLNTFRDDYGRAEREAASELVSALFEVGVSKQTYHEILQDLTQFVPSGAGLNDVYWLLDLADMLCRNATPDEEQRKGVLTAILASLGPVLRQISELQAVAYRRIADIGSWPAIDDERQEGPPDSSQNSVQGLLKGKLVGIYTLTESAARQAATALKKLAPEVKVEISSDHVCSPRLKKLSQNADLFVVTTSSAKHAATDCINQNRSSDSILYAAGRGYCSILRSIEDHCREQIELT